MPALPSSTSEGDAWMGSVESVEDWVDEHGFARWFVV